jgi:ATP-dependent RNA helicase DDX56/DBP9
VPLNKPDRRVKNKKGKFKPKGFKVGGGGRKGDPLKTFKGRRKAGK